MKIRLIRELFNFSRKERAGIISLLLIIFILIVVGKLISYFIPFDKPNFSKWEAEVNTYLANTNNKLPANTVLQLVKFNPNEIDSDRLKNMGLPPKVVSNWVKYIRKGGKFKDKREVRKIFGMTDELVEQLDSFMIIPSGYMDELKTGRKDSKVILPDRLMHDTIFRQTFPKRAKERIAVLELNSTDSLHLLELPGIGPVFASRIIRYRNLLGGFYDVGQLREVYGMLEENYTVFSQFLTADKSIIKAFNINFSDIRELGRHPYVGFKTARKILKLRDKMGKFSSPDDLASVVAADSLKRLIPYIRFIQ
jgi:DNA uptake protein ComE-like DNA-binding protein